MTARGMKTLTVSWRWQLICMLSFALIALGSSYPADPSIDDYLAVGHPEPIPGEAAEADDNFGFLAFAVSAGSPEKGPIPNAEGFPDFETARTIWNGWWYSHVYGFGILFGVMGILCLVALGLADAGYLRDTVLARVVLASLALFSLSRAVFLLADPYGARSIFPNSLIQVLLGLSLPTMSSSYGILLATLVSATSMKARPLFLFQRRKLLYCLLALLLIGYITAEVLVYEFGVMNLILTICQSTFVAWGLVMVSSFAYVGYEINRKMRDLKHVRSARTTKSRNVIVRTAVTSCFLGLAFIASHIYILVNSDISDADASSPWPWYYCATVLRIIELLMVISLFHIVLGSPTTLTMCCDLMCCRRPVAAANDKSQMHSRMGTRSELDVKASSPSIAKIKIAAVASWESGNKPNEASGKKSTSNSMDSLDSDEGASTAGSKKSVDTGISEDSNVTRDSTRHMLGSKEEATVIVGSVETQAQWSPGMTGGSPNPSRYSSPSLVIEPEPVMVIQA